MSFLFHSLRRVPINIRQTSTTDVPCAVILSHPSCTELHSVVLQTEIVARFIVSFNIARNMTKNSTQNLFFPFAITKCADNECESFALNNHKRFIARFINLYDISLKLIAIF